MLTINALIKLTNTPAIIERNTKREIVPLFSGHKTPIPPIHIPMLEWFANHHPEVGKELEEKKALSDELAGQITAAAKEFKEAVWQTQERSRAE